MTKEQCLNGIIKYIDNEVMPALPTASKWIAGTFITLASTQYDKIYRELSANSIIRSLGIINNDGLINVKTALRALRDNADKYGALEFNIPIIGILRFDSTDIEKLQNYLITGDKNNERRIKTTVD